MQHYAADSVQKNLNQEVQKQSKIEERNKATKDSEETKPVKQES